jgi:hypothetical protein
MGSMTWSRRVGRQHHPDRPDQAVADFGETYAGQTERDHAALADAVASGRVQAQMGT